MMSLLPLGERILVKPLHPDKEKMTTGGIIIPKSVDPARVQVDGQIVATGPGMRLADGTCARMRLKVGDRVIFGQYAGAEIMIENEKHFVIRESDVLAQVIEREELGA
jgi:chaperonin GroES